MEKEWVEYNAYGCIATVWHNAILARAMTKEGGLGDLHEVTAPSQEFLNLINKSFDTTFTVEQFEGR